VWIWIGERKTLRAPPSRFLSSSSVREKRVPARQSRQNPKEAPELVASLHKKTSGWLGLKNRRSGRTLHDFCLQTRKERLIIPWSNIRILLGPNDLQKIVLHLGPTDK